MPSTALIKRLEILITKNAQQFMSSHKFSSERERERNIERKKRIEKAEWRKSAYLSFENCAVNLLITACRSDCIK